MPVGSRWRLDGQATVGSNRWLRLDRHAFRVALGRSGISADKREGDGATPCGPLPLRCVFYRADRLPRPMAACSAEPLAPHDGWCDDPSHPDYNRPIRLPHPARHEVLWRADETYDLIGVLGWNDSPPMPGRGSAIFLHVAKPGHPPTEGCVALALPDLQAVLAAGLRSIVVAPPG